MDILSTPSVEILVKAHLSPTDPIRQIRTIVFIEEQQVPAALEWDADDAVATHFLAQTPAKEPIATARLLPSGQIGRMAVLAQYRNQGVGGKLLAAVLQHPIARHQPRLFLHAQLTAISFYEKFGFVCYGEQYEEAGILHHSMERTRD